MKFKKLLQDKLKDKIGSSLLDYIPGSYQIIGDICLIKLKKEVVGHKELIGEAILDILPYIKTVCLISRVEGELRVPKIEKIVGDGTEVLHKENRCSFYLDVSEIMWSKGNQQEKRRLVKLVKDGETIIDMFAGVGYWSIPIARNKNVKIYSIELNPKSYSYLKKNVKLNKVEDKVNPIKGDCRKEIPKLEKVDRIIMGYFPRTIDYLEYALRGAKDECWIHFHEIRKLGEWDKLQRDIVNILTKHKFGLIEFRFNRVKKYAPNVDHAVFDLRIKRKPV